MPGKQTKNSSRPKSNYNRPGSVSNNYVERSNVTSVLSNYELKDSVTYNDSLASPVEAFIDTDVPQSVTPQANKAGRDLETTMSQMNERRSASRIKESQDESVTAPAEATTKADSFTNIDRSASQESAVEFSDSSSQDNLDSNSQDSFISTSTTVSYKSIRKLSNPTLVLPKTEFTDNFSEVYIVNENKNESENESESEGEISHKSSEVDKNNFYKKLTSYSNTSSESESDTVHMPTNHDSQASSTKPKRFTLPPVKALETGTNVKTKKKVRKKPKLKQDNLELHSARSSDNDIQFDFHYDSNHQQESDSQASSTKSKRFTLPPVKLPETGTNVTTKKKVRKKPKLKQDNLELHSARSSDNDIQFDFHYDSNHQQEPVNLDNGQRQEQAVQLEPAVQQGPVVQPEPVNLDNGQRQEQAVQLEPAGQLEPA